MVREQGDNPDHKYRGYHLLYTTTLRQTAGYEYLASVMLSLHPVTYSPVHEPEYKAAGSSCREVERVSNGSGYQHIRKLITNRRKDSYFLWLLTLILTGQML